MVFIKCWSWCIEFDRLPSLQWIKMQNTKCKKKYKIILYDIMKVHMNMRVTYNNDAHVLSRNTASACKCQRVNWRKKKYNKISFCYNEMQLCFCYTYDMNFFLWKCTHIHGQWSKLLQPITATNDVDHYHHWFTEEEKLAQITYTRVSQAEYISYKILSSIKLRIHKMHAPIKVKPQQESKQNQNDFFSCNTPSLYHMLIPLILHSVSIFFLDFFWGGGFHFVFGREFMWGFYSQQFRCDSTLLYLICASFFSIICSLPPFHWCYKIDNINILTLLIKYIYNLFETSVNSNWIHGTNVYIYFMDLYCQWSFDFQICISKTISSWKILWIKPWWLAKWF